MGRIKEGDRVPEVSFRMREDGEWVDRTSSEIFGGKTVVVFALPGAFTPTCSASHLPRYETLAPALRERGVDEIYCLSVNDAFVMDAWGRDQGVHAVGLLPDGNGAFSEAAGFLVGKEDLGFGKRSWRYSMLVRDGVVEKLFVEEEVPGDPYSVSDADTMLRYLDPDVKTPASIAMFSRRGCGHCARARKLLDEKGLSYSEVFLGEDVPRTILRSLVGSDTTPQIYVDGEHVGGADALEKRLAQD